jgi:hypothetical protein
MISIQQAIPCILHLENRVAEKIITMLLARGAEQEIVPSSGGCFLVKK